MSAKGDEAMETARRVTAAMIDHHVVQRAATPEGRQYLLDLLGDDVRCAACAEPIAMEPATEEKIARLVNETAAWGAVVSAAIEAEKAERRYERQFTDQRAADAVTATRRELRRRVDSLLVLREGTE